MGVCSVIFGLMGLLIAFTFSGAASRFDSRRRLVVEETNAIGTAYLRIDLSPISAPPVLRENFRRYVDARLEVYGKLPDIRAAKEERVSPEHEVIPAISGIDQYTLMGALIRGWRNEWGQGDFPFIYIQKPSGGGCECAPSDPVTKQGEKFSPLPAAVPSTADGLYVENHIRIMR
jgi:hypothetical protein